MRLLRSLVSGILPVCIPFAMPSASQGWGLAHTGIGYGIEYLDNLVPEALGPDRSRPWGLEVSQEFFSGHGFRAGLYGEVRTEEEHETCSFLCMDYDMTGHYFWNTRYAGAGLRFSPDGLGFLDNFGFGLGYSRFQYDWGIYKEGLDSQYPSGYFLSGTYTAHQAVLGLDYEFPIHLLGVSIILRPGITKTLAAQGTFTPRLLRQGERPRELIFPERPIALSFSLKVEI